MRPAIAIAAVLLGALSASGCECGRSHTPPDGGPPAPTDSGGPVVRDAGPADRPDAWTAARDGGLVPWPDGWERVPFLPSTCDAWRPRGDVVGAAHTLRFEPCDPPEAGCEQLAIDWERSRSRSSAIIASAGHRTSGEAGILNLGIPFETRMGSHVDWSLYGVDGTPMAVWRIRVPRTGSEGFCAQTAVAIAGAEAAMAFLVGPGTVVTDAFEVPILVSTTDGVQRASSPRLRLTVAELLAELNTAAALHYDGTNVIVNGSRGAVFLGTLGGAPWGPIATCATGDSSNGEGMLFDGAFYWTGSPCGERGWQRIRRRRPGATANETFMQRADGHIDGFRTDGTWAVWMHLVDDSPADGRTDRTDVFAARVEGTLDPASWRPRLVSTFPGNATAVEAVLSSGRYAFPTGTRLVKLVDLEGNRRMQIASPGTDVWVQIQYLGPDYLFLVHAGTVPFEGMRRYRIADLEGWRPID